MGPAPDRATASPGVARPALVDPGSYHPGSAKLVPGDHGLVVQPPAQSEPGDVGPTRAGPGRPGISRRWAIGLAVVLLLLVVVGLSAALVVTNLRVSARPDLSKRQVGAIARRQAGTAVSRLQSQPPVAVPVYRAVEAAFVVVQSEGGAAGTGDLGSGVIVDKQGDILTALHVVRGASTIEVGFADGATSAATVTSSDATHDIAVETVDPTGRRRAGCAGQCAADRRRGVRRGQPTRPRCLLVGRGRLGVEPGIYTGRRGVADGDDPVRRGGIRGARGAPSSMRKVR